MTTMLKINYRRTAAALAAAVLTCTAWAHTMPSLAIDNAEICTDDATLELSFILDPSSYNIGSNRQLTLTPVVTSGDSIAAMHPVVIAGYNRYYHLLRRPEAMPQGAVLIRSGKKEHFSYNEALPMKQWMLQSKVEIKADESGCCGAPERNDRVSVAQLDLRPASFMVPPDYSVKAPAASDNKTTELSGSAYIDFRVNRTEIDPSYRRNPEELAAILVTIDTVVGNPDATINRIEIKGFASPEGKYSNNERLAKGRTKALKEYVIKTYGFEPSIFDTSFEPEDWDGLRRFLQKSALQARNELLDIANNSKLSPDEKDNTMRRRFPADYKFLLDNVYPGLRHSDYKVNYTIRTYTDIEEIRRIMEERPGNLSLNEFYLLAHSYTPGSDEYNRVFDTAVRVYPNDPVSNLNAAAVAVNKGDFLGAERFLARCADRPEAAYIRGVAMANQGKFSEAKAWLINADKAGIDEAAAPLENVNKILDKQDRKIEYIPDNHQNIFTKKK